jgi:hypothetical protein
MKLKNGLENEKEAPFFELITFLKRGDTRKGLKPNDKEREYMRMKVINS